MTNTDHLIVRERRLVATDALLLHLEHPDGRALPSYQPGAHLALHLKEDLERRYSLLFPYETSVTRYSVCVKLDAASLGGSRYIHSNLVEGALVRVSPPENYFPLEEQAQHSVLIAGGIGITPIHCMASRLQAMGRSWELHYAVRTRNDAICLDGQADLSRRSRLYLTEERAERLSIEAIIAGAPTESHLYCCGPEGMLDEFRKHTQHLPKSLVHFESFGASQAVGDSESFTVELARDGRVFHIPETQSILDSLRAGGVQLPYSCRQGVCGACETRVVAGTPDHRDMVLSETERKANKTMIICCSRSKGDHLVLDL